ncbi:uncharacterized protein EAF02_005251 [Botrytis sinoallii]|uniref:uncharacterized protein n=1 Tax=Botrytis sinoallii TaxID=1463999 RepID=UPI0019015BEE|nr:uncharacterized protein EAF02_005251 [Botrytis sinoallii]KAF7883331.1 hypothetical protein EAF02_005251 [Botrytis sinoallii]
MPLSLLAECTAFILAALCLIRIVREYFSPLSSIPSAGVGAAYSRLLWAFPTEFRGRITLDLPKLHEKLGPLVRISPNEVSFYSMEMYDAVHKVNSRFKKDPRVYGEFVQGGSPALFSITDPVEHSKRRRLMGQLFNRSQMYKLKGLMLHHIDQFVQTVASSRDRVKLLPVCRALEADIMSHFSFGHTIGALDAYFQGAKLDMIAKNDEKATWMPLLTSFPGLCNMWEWVEQIVSSKTGYRTPYNKAMHDFHQVSILPWIRSSLLTSISGRREVGAQRFQTTQIRKKPTSPFPNLVQTMINSNLPSSTALSEATENLGPGTDTTSATLAHILWTLRSNPDFQEELFQDLAAVSFPTDMTTLEGIPRFWACKKEGIRWTGAAAAMLPRLVPEGGAEFYGNFLPENTVISSSPIWYLRDSVAFPRPKEFDPYRWLTSDGQKIRDDPLRDKFYIPFSKGANICMGAHFAYLELFLSISQIIRNFRVHMHPLPHHRSYSDEEKRSSPGVFRHVELPNRREWVAAVPTERLMVALEPRL